MAAVFPASSKGGGVALGVPDVCKTPTPPAVAPIPYPNIGLLKQAAGTSSKVKFVAKEAVHVNSEIPTSKGGEPGTAGGVVSGVNMGKVAFTAGSAKVLIEGEKCVHFSATTSQNKGNVPGAQIAPSQSKVIIAK